MKYVLLLVLMMAFVNPSEAREPAMEVKVIATVMGQVEKANSRTLSNIVACGYELTKGHAYNTWGPSVTFFVETADGIKKELYKMQNGTRAFEPIQTLNISTANDHEFDKLFQTPTSYNTIYIAKDLMEGISKKLSLVRAFRTNDTFKSGFETQIKRIDFKQWQRVAIISKEQINDISCVF